MGATICDAVLQAGVNYTHTVEPRVNRILKDYPAANTTSKFAETIKREGIGKILNWKVDSRKPKILQNLIDLFLNQGIETIDQLATWLKNGDNHKILKTIHGVGDKTVDYFCIFIGLPNVAIDRHLIEFLKLADIEFKGYEEANNIIQQAAVFLQIEPQILDHSIWKYMSQNRT